MRRVSHSLEEEQLLWALEVERSQRDFARAVREGMVPDAWDIPRRAAREALRAQSRELIRRSRILCDEARVLRDSSRLLRDSPPTLPAAPAARGDPSPT